MITRQLQQPQNWARPRNHDSASASEDQMFAVNATSTVAAGASSAALDPKDVGMDATIKEVYGGKEDRHGNFEWHSEMPQDIAAPVENAESQKFAIVVRHKRVYNDPKKVLEIHSIAIQSPLLRELLAEVLEGYPGVTPGLKNLEFSGRCESLIHRWPVLRTKIAELEKQRDDAQIDQLQLSKRIEHANLLQNLLVQEFSDVEKASADMLNNGVITYEHLWVLFQPGTTVYAKLDNQDRAFRLQSTKYGVDRDQNPCFWLVCTYVDYDGQRFGTLTHNIDIRKFEGTASIQMLSAYPMEFHNERGDIEAKLTERGGKIEELSGIRYRSYNGVGWRKNKHYGTKDKISVCGRVVVDGFGFNRFAPDQAVYVTPFNAEQPATDSQVGSATTDALAFANAQLASIDYRVTSKLQSKYGITFNTGGMPADGFFETDDKDNKERTPLTDEQKMLCSPFVRGYALREKIWLNLFVNCVADNTFSDNAFDALTLPKAQKSLILAFCEHKKTDHSGFDDVIAGKGQGLIILLSGPPGVGKTLTAESVAERMKVPLFIMAAGDLGISSADVEQKLNDCLAMCSRWNAILLLDEADIILEQRNMHELERNKLVSIFLRVLEYYQGIMFLTTNRVETFDTAFASRIHLSLEYPELNKKSRKGIWETFLKRLPEHSMSEKDISKLAEKELNGREIKNFLKSAQLLATHEKETLGYEHVETVIDTMAHLHKASKASSEAKSSIFQ
ncbi:putative 26S proteasome regulatory subunit-like [Pseudocercospora fuligena]|uniref:Putative 26S proteasome regulatory subunit-like n=1 Tax=Pseudocercospora fuligena TaxID=685502 RepID=A0A8H6VG79_9PEZI|nr:putative 26S proteasome regulatory subunit-like [Pseudocercospora fuligena]